ncbi:MAG: hypothetical protein ACHREM_06755, partial [Polyangiales bacterium]
MRSDLFGRAGFVVPARRLALSCLVALAIGASASCAGGSSGEPDDGSVAGDGTSEAPGDETGGDASLGDASDATTGDSTDESGDATIADINLGDSTVSDLLGVCVLGTSGPTGTCASPTVVDFGAVGASVSVMRLVRLDDRGLADIQISSIAATTTDFTVTTVLYIADSTGTLVRTPQTLPYTIPSGKSLYAEVSIVGAAAAGPLPSNTLKIMAAIAPAPAKEIDVPIAGAFSGCDVGRGSCDPDPTKVCTTDIANDPNNCGGCNVICSYPHGTPVCVAGKCGNAGCDTNWVDCDGVALNGCETNVYTDTKNCGSCAFDCTRAETNSYCAAGHCNITGCAAGYADCDLDPLTGCETNINTSMGNCGGCNLICDYANASETCTSGVCVFGACNAGFLDCDKSVKNGCEVNSTNDPNNCASCGNACTFPNATALCTASVCTLGPCNTGFTDCNGVASDGCESYGPTDTSNCGTCGNNCATVYPNAAVGCTSGACQFLGCNFGFYDKNKSLADGCEYASPTDLLQLCVLNSGGPLGLCASSKILDFGSLSPGDTQMRLFRYTNIGPLDIVIDSDSVATTDFTIVTVRYEADPGGGPVPLRVPQTLPFTVKPTKALYFEVTLKAGATAGPIPTDKVHTQAHIGTEGDEDLVVNMAGDEYGCPAGTAACGTDPTKVCDTNISSNVNACGGCTNVCSAPHATVECDSGVCKMNGCVPGWADCNGLAVDGCEVNIASDGANCGTCGFSCAEPNTATMCSVGTCVVTACTAPWADCDGLASNGCETDTSSSLANCGACKSVCSLANATESCFASKCLLGVCNAGYADCDGIASDGCEINTTDDTNNCGACGTVCNFANAGALCTSSSCALGACNKGFADCDGVASDGCEVYLPTDTNNCGTCGNNCSTVYPHSIVGCGTGTCTFEGCAPGYVNKDGSLSNGCEYASPSLFLSLCVLGTGGPTGACLTPQVLAFGTITPGSTPMQLFKLTNTGDQAVSIDNVVTDAGGFTETDVLYVAISGGGTARTVITLPYLVPPGGTFFVESATLGTALAGAFTSTKVEVTTHIGSEPSEEIDVSISGNDAGCAKGTASCDGLDSNGCEVNTNIDLGNCGACFSTCAPANAAATCSGGVCLMGACSSGFADCDLNAADGCEINTQTDMSNCGACKSICGYSNASATCAGGSCNFGACNPGYVDCNKSLTDGCEINTTSDANNCGACNNVCTYANAGAVCTTSACAMAACNPGFSDCDGLSSDGCEVYLPTDKSNCGTCGNDCAKVYPHSAVSCGAGACSWGGCLPGYQDKNGTLADGCEYASPTLFLNLCVLGTGGPTGACLTPKVLNFGSVTPGSTPMRLFELTNTGDQPVSIDDVVTDAGGFTEVDVLYVSISGGGTARTVITLPYLIPPGGTFFVETSTLGTAVPGALASTKVKVTAHVGSEPSEEIDVPIGGTDAGCAKGTASCDGLDSNGCEVTTDTDLGNCGTCFSVCAPANAGATCSGGVCHMGACSTGFADCDLNPADGCEINTNTDMSNCGGCKAVCGYANASATCAGGSCNFGACNTGYVDCNHSLSDGCEINTTSDAKNCGACNNACSYANAAPVCSGSTCSMGTCNTNFEDCNGLSSDGCESYAPTDVNNCGSCGHACANVYPHSIVGCSTGTCGFGGCLPGYLNKNGSLSDGCEYASPSLFLSLCVLGTGGSTGACITPQVLAFGSVAPGSTPLQLFKLTNTGDQAVSIDSVATDAGGFTETDVLYVSISGGGTARTVITLPYLVPPGGTFFVESSTLGTAAAGPLGST